MTRHTLASLFALIAAATAILGAQSATVDAHLAAARKLAGTQWAPAADLFCATEQQVAEMKILPSANEDNVAAIVAEPMKVFDNLYFVGQKTVATWALVSSDGIILIDSGYKDRVEDTLLAGMKKVGLDPSRIRYVLIAHEHADHFGGARPLQDRFPTLQVGASAAAWAGMEKGAQASEAPRRGIVLEEGKAVTLGDVSVTPVAIPGHTAGSLGFIFPVKDSGRTHIAGLFGGTVLNPTKAIPFEQYEKSIQHWGEWTKKMRVDVELQNHPIMDRAFERMAQLAARKGGAPHPFVVGEASYQQLVGVMRECAQAQLARRRAG
jgi:metallo-beta-lactamase class B